MKTSVLKIILPVFCGLVLPESSPKDPALLTYLESVTPRRGLIRIVSRQYNMDYQNSPFSRGCKESYDYNSVYHVQTPV